MIDTHSHILPSIDDGASDLTDSLAMARLAIAHGIHTMIATPHIIPGIYDNNSTTITSAYQQLVKQLDQENIPLTLHYSAEVRLSPEIVPLIQRNQIPFMGTWQEESALLLELPHNIVPPGSHKMIAWLRNQNIRPIIAHPERNEGFITDHQKLTPFFEAECLFQVTASSITGEFGPAPQELAWQLLQQQKIHFLVTDTHDCHYRPPNMQTAYQQISQRLGETYAKTLVQDNPMQLL
ncbi:tyrosine-protein phosphatase [Magnetococcales bacterium HHB-1]